MKQNMKEAIGLSLKRYNDTYMKAANDRIDNIVSQAGTDNTEIVDARIDSAGVTHTTLNNRILAETKMNDEQLVTYTGSNISAEDTTQGYLKDVEIFGNTIQNEEDLADIKSVGVLQEDGTYKMSILSCGKNLLNLYNCNFSLSGSDSTLEVISSNCLKVSKNTPNAFFTTMLKLKPNTTYRLSFVKTGTDQSVLGISNSSGSITEQNKTTTLSDGIVKLYARASGVALAGTEIFSNIQLEEGTQSTPYEPYQENKCDILLPCQFEKVGDVSDRLYYDDVEKAWCIEKHATTYVITGNEAWNNGSMSQGLYSSWCSNIINNRISTNKICYTSVKYTNSTEEYLSSTEPCCLLYTNGVNIKIGATDLTSFKNKIKGMKLTYLAKTPQKIVLPLSTQIALNSFFGTTHIYMKSGEVEGIIKCKIPKSLGATVQSLNNKTDILSDRIEAIEGLKDSQNMKYETDKGYLVCKETKNGVIDDLKIEGKTLVNLAPFKNKTNSSNLTEWIYNVFDKIPLQIGKEYTFIFDLEVIQSTDDLNCVLLEFKDSNGYTLNSIQDGGLKFNGTNSKKIISKLTIQPNTDQVLLLWKRSGSATSMSIKNFIILEGDHTQNPPSYFEGLMSVGQDVDEIEVLSRKEDGNLFDKESIHLNKFLQTNGDETSIEGWFVSDYIKVADTCYIKGLINNASSNLARICVYDQNKTFKKLLSQPLNTTLNISQYIENGDYIKITEKIEQVDDIIVCKNEISNQIYQSDKKQILFYNENGELEPIQELHEWDSIEKHSDNKWYYHKRSGKVVLNGSENWNSLTLTASGLEEYAGFGTPIENGKVTLKGSNYVIDTHGFASQELDTINNNGYLSEALAIHVNGNLYIRILKSKLSSQDVAGFKQWLQANNVTVVYQLAEEEVYELAPLHLDSYANETLILCNSGAISPKMEFSITSHINELVKAYGERVNLLEEKVYQYMVTQNRMQLASTYSADSVTFKVDYFSLCGDEENYDEDLYNLILNNILVGKDNYDYDKMFTMILDYASWNQISWEQFDILVGLMDMQHNPPVEELPTEDGIEEDIIENEETPVE